jgi:Autophagocytosis associated protein, active-site domain
MCWYLHPCETQQAVEELLVARKSEVAEGATMGSEEWLEVWMLVLGSVLNLED